MNYDKKEFGSYLLKGQLREAMNYLKSCPEKKEWLEGYINIFENGEYYPRTDNEVLGLIDNIYQKYYRNIFWNEVSDKEAEYQLFNELWVHCGSNPELQKDETIEDEIAKIVNAEGYEFLGGSTQGFFGPYIWKSSTKVTYDVELPTGIQPYTIVMMDGFISRSWLDFLSFGNSGVGGWADDNGMLYCVKSSYDNKEENVFQISFLKHEAQHAYDKNKYKDISSTQLEYRAKLVELIYWPDAEKIKYILMEADNSNPDNSHSVAAYRIINTLSSKIFECEYMDNEKEWVKKIDDVKAKAFDVLMESNNELEQYLVEH
ncbi:MAG: hypothetical protein K0S41_757 [Anaerocolumna sp.]|jgi:hypothetical protein|nr:hypothetical protein [Anaerocolumna sp.]